MITKTIEIADVLLDYIPASITRLSYLFPDVEFDKSQKGIQVTIKNEADFREIKREVMHQLYRERIFAETLELRKNYYKMLST